MEYCFNMKVGCFLCETQLFLHRKSIVFIVKLNGFIL